MFIYGSNRQEKLGWHGPQYKWDPVAATAEDFLIHAEEVHRPLYDEHLAPFIDDTLIADEPI